MEYYIAKYEPEATRKTVLDEFKTKIDISKCHATGRRYPTIKNWFLEKYPAVAMCGMNESELAAYKRAQEEKSKREDEEKKSNVISMPQQNADDNYPLASGQ